MASTPAHSEAEATRRRAVWPVFALAILSLAAVLIVQVNVAPRSSAADQPLLPLAIGLGLALLAGWGTTTAVLLLGVAAVVGFPLWAIGDMLLHPGPHDGPEHNLLPFEFLMYGFYMALAYLAALVGRGLRGRIVNPLGV
jgi:hypothetical protein